MALTKPVVTSGLDLTTPHTSGAFAAPESGFLSTPPASRASSFTPSKR
jgi:hypothetical protein